MKGIRDVDTKNLLPMRTHKRSPIKLYKHTKVIASFCLPEFATIYSKRLTLPPRSNLY